MSHKNGLQAISRYLLRPGRSVPLLHSVSGNRPWSSPHDDANSRMGSNFAFRPPEKVPGFQKNVPFQFFPYRAYSVQPDIQTPTNSFARYSQPKDQPYARNVVEYNQAMISLCKRRKVFLLREVYDDMLLDGVQPNRETFLIAIPGLMRGNKLQDAFFFFNEMKANGIVPDIVLYNSMISTCGRCLQVDRAFQVAEEMEAMGIKPKFRTFVALLNACGLAGRVNEAFGVIKRMTLAGLTMNKYCYSALINAYKNRRPILPDATTKIFELLQQSKSTEGKEDNLLNAALGETDDMEFAEEQGLGTEFQARRGFLNRNLIVYHAVLRAMVDLRNRLGVAKLLKIMEEDGLSPDAFTYTQIIKINLGRNGNLDKALEAFNNFISTGAVPTLDLYISLIEGCIKTFSPKGMDSAKKLLNEMLDRGFFLNPKIGSNLLALASREIGGDYSTASLIFEIVTKDQKFVLLQPVFSFVRGLLRRGVPLSDPRIVKATELITKRIPKFTIDSLVGKTLRKTEPTDANQELNENSMERFEDQHQEEFDDYEHPNGEDGQFQMDFNETNQGIELEKQADVEP